MNMCLPEGSKRATVIADLERVYIEFNTQNTRLNHHIYLEAAICASSSLSSCTSKSSTRPLCFSLRSTRYASPVVNRTSTI